ncbi:hypothetical protein [Crocosphaera sp.]|uniref:hypothetical protein n=1 Tax=Crocosphaera sp. TaxID=2729996 RepID=UPI003F24EEDF|nr:hypothetical protein [Crocosphaera sp.]
MEHKTEIFDIYEGTKSLETAWLETHLLAAKSPEEIQIYLNTYQELIKENLFIKTHEHQRFMDKFQIIRQTCIWGIIISIAVGLIIARLTIPAFILIVIVFYDFIIDYSKFRNKTK